MTPLISKDNIPLIQIIPNIKILILLHLNQEFICIYKSKISVKITNY